MESVEDAIELLRKLVDGKISFEQLKELRELLSDVNHVVADEINNLINP